GSVKDALRLGCVGVGFTIYPGSEANYGMMEEFRELSAEAKANGLVSVLWSYPRGGNVTKEGETALDIVAYAAHMAALLGATIIKVKPPKAGVDLKAAQSSYENVPMDSLKDRIAHVMQCCFNGKRLVVFSGGEAKSTDGLLGEIREIRDGGGSGSIVGRNSFQRPRAEALDLLGKIIEIYKQGA
ncbi:MAG: class I fructose-bisphosphate aldolase, partial [Geminicoccaceae bacterium]|nr:class I fructose-bisphosphate aldolase [Geminicoccaceae bacterium]